MKKIAVLILTAVLLLAFTGSSLANSVYLDYLIEGETKTDPGSAKFDSEKISLGGNFRFNDTWSVGGEFATGKIKLNNRSDADITSYKIKGGFAVINDEGIRVDLTAGYYRNEWDYDTKAGIGDLDSIDSYDSYLVGADAEFNLSNNLVINAGIEYGISGKCKLENGGDLDLDSLLTYKIGISYYFTEAIGLSLGYRSTAFELKDSDDKITTSGCIAGVTYRF